jgi:hypothetical protein
VFVAGTARSGTTWLSELINHRNEYRYVFEPFDHRKVPRVAPLGGRRYLRPDDDDPAAFAVAEHVLTGRIRHPWTERFNRRLVADRRLVKDVRANLFLGWMRARFPGMPIVLMLRHPFAVALSYEKQGWRGSVETLLAQDRLVEDHLGPLADTIAGARDAFERALCIWCVETLVPLRQLRPGDAHVVFYESLVESPEVEVPRLLAFLGRPFDPSVLDAVSRPSLTARRGSAVATGGNRTGGWREKMGGERLERAREIVRRFGLDGLYTEDGRPDPEALATLSEE